MSSSGPIFMKRWVKIKLDVPESENEEESKKDNGDNIDMAGGEVDDD